VTSSVIDDVVEVNRIVTMLPMLVVLSYPPMSISLSETSVTTGQRCFFVSGALCLIVRLIPNRGLVPMVPYRRLYCNDLAHRFGPLLHQSH
jgi:hypothetical protein